MRTEFVKEEVEKPGKNAVDHFCEMKVENPEEEGQFVKCLILANLQCAKCTAWICGEESVEHTIICVRCDQPFCPEHYQEHRLENRCLEIAA